MGRSPVSPPHLEGNSSIVDGTRLQKTRQAAKHKRISVSLASSIATNKSAKRHIDVTKLPIRVEYAEEPLDRDALRDALEQLLLAVESDHGSDCIQALDQSDEPIPHHKQLERVPRLKPARATGCDHGTS